MERYWDQKIVKLRADLNVHSLIKRLDDKASVNQTNNLFDEASIRIEGCEEHLEKLGQDMQYVAKSFSSIRKYVVDIKKIHSECSKSASWLSCGTDNNSNKLTLQSRIKGNNSNKLPGFLKKGRQPLDDPTLSEYDIGLNVFPGRKFRPKSAKKIKTHKRLRVNAGKLGREYSK
jgi:hypothetical protein